MRKKQILLFYLCLLFIFANNSIAKQSKKVTCTGQIVDEQGLPIVGAKVTVYEMQFDGIAGNFMLRQVGEIITEEDGKFIFTSEPKPERSTFHDCKIVAVKEGLALGWTIWNMREDTESNIQLGEPKELAGIVVDEAGKPVTNAEIRANLLGIIETAKGKEKNWLPGISPLDELGAHTDTEGRFSINNISTEVDVYLRVTAPGRALTYTYQSDVSKSAFKAGQTDIKVVLPAEARIEGKITDPDTGKGIAGTKFAVVSASSGLFYYRFVHTTNDDGTFSIGGLQTGQYLLRNGGFPSTHVDVESGKTTNITVEADRLSRPKGITGIVRDQQGKPLPNAVVKTYPPITEETVTDARGVFTLKSGRLRRSDDGVIYLLVRHKEHNLAFAAEFDESTDNIEVKLTPGVIFSGKVADVNDNGIPNAQISLTFWISDSGYGEREPTEIDSDGNFEIRAIPIGYRYSIEASADGYGTQYVTAHTSDTDSDHMELETLALSVANLSVSGVVVDMQGKPVANAQVNASGRGQPYRGDIRADEQGDFKIDGVCSGPLRLWANVRGKRNMYGSTESEGGATDVKIVVAELDSSGRIVPIQPPSLVGKTLPKLKEFGIESLPDTNDKMMFVCFFDMEQRPSRNCITQLSNRAQDLKAKDIIVIAIQASKIDKSSLDEWIKDQNISIPVGMIEANEEKTRFTWGIRSLPWLILTDKSHMVSSNGFSLAELKGKIQSAQE